MAKENIKLPVRSALIPVFYQNFHCLAQDCRDSCCVNWDICFDKKDYLRLRRLDAPPALRERLDRGVRREKKGNHDSLFYARFDLKSNGDRCPFLDEDGLCAIQRACGHDALPNVCTTYPRIDFYTTAAKEYALTPSCEGVLQLLWDLPEGVEFVEDPLTKAEYRVISISPDENMLAYFAPVRSLFIDVLQNRAMPLTERMLCLGILIQRLQKEDWEHFDPDGWTVRAEALAAPETIVGMNIPGNRDMFLAQNLAALRQISKTEKDWINNIFESLHAKWGLALYKEGDDSKDLAALEKVDFSRDTYADALAQFQTAFSDREYFFENLMVAAALYLCFPVLKSKEELWKSYVSLCNLYSFYRFAAVSGCKDKPTKEQLFHIIALSSRSILHSPDRFTGFQEHLFKHDSSTLAHMAILLRWD